MNLTRNQKAILSRLLVGRYTSYHLSRNEDKKATNSLIKKKLVKATRIVSYGKGRGWTRYELTDIGFKYAMKAFDKIHPTNSSQYYHHPYYTVTKNTSSYLYRNRDRYGHYYFAKQKRKR